MTIFRHGGKTTTGQVFSSQFIAKWDTTQPGSANDTVVLPLVADGSYNFYIDWGDGNRDTITGHNQPEVTHQYSDTGIYTIRVVSNNMVGWQFNDSGDDDKLTEIMEWGPLRFVSDDTNLFKGCSNLTLSTTSDPPFNADAAGMFQDCSSLTGTGGNILNWDMSAVTGMNFMLAGCTSLDPDLSNWDVSSIENAEGFMSGAGLSTMNYDRILSGWSSQGVQSGVNISFGDARYSEESGEAFRNLLTSAETGWIITDGGAVLKVIPRFISTWDTRKTNYYSTSTTKIKLPITNSGIYDFEVNWGDGLVNHVTNASSGGREHTYSSPGVYTISITGTISGWNNTADGYIADNGMDAIKLTCVHQWDGLKYLNPDRDIQLGTPPLEFYNQSRQSFGYSKHLTGLPLDAPQTDSSGYMRGFLLDCEGITGAIDAITGWDVSSFRNIQEFFSSVEDFDADLSHWDVSNVTNISMLFNSCSTFKNGGSPNITGWDVSNATNMRYMFSATPFNHPIGNWDVSSVTRMDGMFNATKCFNQDIGAWDVSNVTNMHRMFDSIYNHPSGFNNGGSSSISGWDTSSVTDFEAMFRYSRHFNQPIGSWDVSSATTMRIMFQGASFNQPIGDWNTSSLTNIQSMFESANGFNQSLAGWDVSNITSAGYFMHNVTLSTANYAATLNGWAPQNVQNGVSISFGNSRYGGGGATARQTLINKGWTIIDGGL